MRAHADMKTIIAFIVIVAIACQHMDVVWGNSSAHNCLSHLVFFILTHEEAHRHGVD
jgi:hypothetical protein